MIPGRNIRLMCIGVGLFLLLTAGAHAARLTNAKAVRQEDGRTLLVMTFDQKVTPSLATSEGDYLTIKVPGLEESTPQVQSAGLVSGVMVERGQITVIPARSVQARVMPAGTGLYVLTLSPGGRASQTASSGQTSGRSNATAGGEYVPPPPSAPPIEIGLDDLPDKVRSAQQAVLSGQADKALNSLKRIKRKDPAFGWSRIIMGNIYMMKGEPNRALDSYREALRVDETEELAAAKLALTFQQMGNRDAASGMWERLLRLNDGILVDLGEESVSMQLAHDTAEPPEAEKPEEDDKEGGGGIPPMVPAMIVGGVLLAAGGYGFNKWRVARWKKMVADIDGDDDFDFDEDSAPAEDEEDEPPKKKKKKKKKKEVFDDDLFDEDALDAAAPYGMDDDEPEPAPRSAGEESDEDIADIPWGGGEGLEEEPSPEFDAALAPTEDDEFADLDDDDDEFGMDDAFDASALETPDELALEEESDELDFDEADDLFGDEEDDDDVDMEDDEEGEEEDEVDDDEDDSDIGDPIMRKIEALHKQGAGVREIAETLGIGQDEVKMVIRLVEEEDEV
ncbi:hypothetical protein GF324_13065 [bacterium]|nr:hypothetical protein [bacterium]